MSRQANFSELRDAIRQGQAKIAQGLKSGQMRSDGSTTNRVSRPRLDPAREVLGKKPGLAEKSAILQGRKKPAFRFSLPKVPKIRLRLPRIPLPAMQSMVAGIVVVLGVGLVVLVVFWIGKALTRPRAEPVPSGEGQVVAQQPDVAPVVPSEPVVPRPVRPPVTEQRPPQTVPVQPDPTPQTPVQPTGNNAIVIQYITSSREGELRPVQEFFAQNGVPVEIIRRGNGSYLVTRDRFDNPNRTGTDGHAMLLRIRGIGRRYATETGDRQWGATPFQDAYGMLME